MDQQVRILLEQEQAVEAGYREKLFQLCGECQECPSTDMFAGRTLCQYCIKYQHGPFTGLASLDLSAGKLIERLSMGRAEQVRKRLEILIEEKMQQLLQLKAQALQQLASKETQGLDLAETLVGLKMRLAEGQERIGLLRELQALNSEFRKRLLNKQTQDGFSSVLAKIESQFSNAGLVVEPIPQINPEVLEVPEVEEQTHNQAIKLVLKERVNKVGTIRYAVVTREGKTIIGCGNGLFQLTNLDKHLIPKGGSIYGLVKDENGTVYGTSSTPGYSIFILGEDLKANVICENAPVSDGLSVSGNKIYFGAIDNGYKVKLLQNGQIRDIMSSKSYISSLANFKGSLFVGEGSQVSHVDSAGRVTTVLTAANGVAFRSVQGLCAFGNRLFISDRGNKRVATAKIVGGRLTFEQELKVEGVTFDYLWGLHCTGEELLICDAGSKEVVTASIVA